MIADVDRSKFADALKAAAKVAAEKSAVKALKCVRLQVSGHTLRIEASDMEKAIRIPLHAQVGEEGAALVPAKLAATVAERMPKRGGDPDAVLLVALSTVAERNLRIVADGVSATLVGESPEDFPAIPWTGDEEPRAKVNAAALGEAITAALPAAATDGGRPVLCGVCVIAAAESLDAVATDGRRLHIASLPDAVGPSELKSVVLPVKTAKWIAKQLADEEGDALVVFAPEAVEIRLPSGTAIWTKLVAGVYPNYSQVVPTVSGEGTAVKRSALADALRRSAALGENAPVRISADGDTLALRTKSAEGEICENIEVQGAAAWEESLYDADYVADALRALGTAEARLHGDGKTPMLMEAVGAHRLAVVMPLRNL